MLHVGRFSTGGQGGGQLHTPRTPRQPPAREIPQWRNKSEAAPTYPTRGNVGFCLKIERKQQKKGKKKIVGFFYSPAHPQAVGKAEGWGAGWKMGGEIHPLALDPPPLGKSHAMKDLKNFFTSLLKYHFIISKALGSKPLSPAPSSPG